MKQTVSSLAALSVSAAALFVTSTASAAPGEGIRMGSFIVAPTIEVEQRFDDNIFIEAQGKDSDTITRVNPEVEVRSDWNRHSLSFDAGIDADFYWENSSDNSIDFNVGTKGEIDITRDIQLRLGARYDRTHSNRGADDVNNAAANPLVQNAYSADAEVHAQFNRIGVTAGGDVTFRDYDDVDAVAGGANINEDDRDRVETGVDLRLGFEARKGYEIFVFGRADQRNFNDAVDDDGRNRDSDGYRLRAGVAFKPSRKLNASISAGVLGRNFDDPNFGDVNAFDFAASLDWDLPNNLTNLTLSVTRNVSDATDLDVAGRLTTLAKLEANHALTRAIELNGVLGYLRTEEEGNAGTRDNDTYGIGLGAKYNFNRRFDLGARYEYKHRVSNEVGGGYVSNTVFLRANFKL